MIGGGQRARKAARQAAAEAIAFVLGGEPDEGDEVGELEYLDVAVG